VSGNTVVVGADLEGSHATGVNGDQNDNSASGSGAAYVFVRNGINWSQQVYLKASNTEDAAIPGVFADLFGASVAVSGDTVAIGAFREDSDATGVNGDQTNNSARDSGAAYVFKGVGAGPQLVLVPDGSGGFYCRIYGGPDVNYQLQRAFSVTGPWIPQTTLSVDVSGFVEFHDTNAPPTSAFYRTVQP